MSTQDLIRSLLDRKGEVVAKQRELHSKLEASKEWSAEDDAQWTRMSEEIDDLTRRAEHLFDMQETERQNAEQRERFQGLLGTNTVPDQGQEERSRIRQFMRASLPGTDNWAPKYLEIKGGSEVQSLVKGTPSAGGFLVPTSFSNQLMQHLVEMAAVRQTRARVLRTTSGESLQVPKTTAYGTAAIVSEGGAISTTTGDPVFGQVTLGAFKYAVIVQVSRELVQDEAVDIVGELARITGLELGLANGAHLVTGTGTGQPQGVANSPVQGIGGNIANAAALTTDNLFDLYHGIVTGYRGVGEWVMNDLTVAQVRKFKDSTNQYLWQPGLSEGAPDRLLGRPIVADPSMPRSGAGAALILFGDFNRFYTIRDVDGVVFERSDDFAFSTDLVSYRALIRTDAKQVNNDTTASAVKAIIMTA